MTVRSSTLLSTTLFVALGLVGAFVASGLAGWWDDEPPADEATALDPGIQDPSGVRIEVLNGAGTSGLARDATHHLRGAGFDVVFFGNARRFDHPRTTVIDRTGELDRARAVAAALGVDSVTTAIDSSLMLDVTVVLGRDWPPAPAPERPHWSDRVREWVGHDTVAPAGGDSAVTPARSSG